MLLMSFDAGAQPRLRLLGVDQYPAAISDDRTTAVGTNLVIAEAFRWRADTGFTNLGHLPFPFDGLSRAIGVSRDGGVVAGYDYDFSRKGFPKWAFRWTQETGIVPLGPRPGEDVLNGSIATGISDSGSTIVGSTEVYGFPRPVVWTELEEIVVPTSFGGAGWCITDDGATLVGTTFFNEGSGAFLWTVQGGIQPLREPDGSLVQIVSHDTIYQATFIVGTHFSSQGQRACLWTAKTGTMFLGDLPGGRAEGEALAVTGDGSTIYGYSSVDVATDGFVWDAKHGIRNLRDVLIAEHGFSQLKGFTQVTALDVTSDGRVIVGYCVNTEGNGEGFVVYLGRTCIADWNDDGIINSQDFFTYIEDYFRPSPVADPNRDADMDGDGDADSTDFFDFLAAFFAGCG